MTIRFGPMDLRQRWVIARQDAHTDWEFFVDRDAWAADFHAAVLFHTLWGAEEALVHSAGASGMVRNAAEVAEFVLSQSPLAQQAEAAVSISTL